MEQQGNEFMSDDKSTADLSDKSRCSAAKNEQLDADNPGRSADDCVKQKWPRGNTFACAWCGDRCDSIKDFDGAFDSKTGKPICGACEGTL